jgi:hypothetical protein
MMLFSPDNYTKPYDDGSLVTVCCYCADVAWPIGARRAEREWIAPDVYYARGGPSDVALSHGICPNCFRTIVEPNIL